MVDETHPQRCPHLGPSDLYATLQGGKGLFRTIVMKAINQLVLIKEVCLVYAAPGFRRVEHGRWKPAKNTRLLPSITGGQWKGDL